MTWALVQLGGGLLSTIGGDSSRRMLHLKAVCGQPDGHRVPPAGPRWRPRRLRGRRGKRSQPREGGHELPGPGPADRQVKPHPPTRVGDPGGHVEQAVAKPFGLTARQIA